MSKHFYKQFCVLLLLLLTLGACKKEGQDNAPTQNVTPVTIENYNLIAVNMTLVQVEKILGKGVMVSAGNYSWSADNSNSIVIYVTFSSGGVSMKRQTGLISATPSGGCPATYNGKTVYTGPRGGCYYINSNGNKTYI